jgi:hypothetical protein
MMDSNLARLMAKRLEWAQEMTTLLVLTMDTMIHNVISSIMDMMLVSIPRV